MPLVLTEYLRRMRGGSQSHLMRAEDGKVYVVKFQGNPQGTHVLFNELFAARLAQRLGLPTANTCVVQLPDTLAADDRLHFELASGKQQIQPGLHLGSEIVLSTMQGRIYDILPITQFCKLRNASDLFGILAFDKWVCNIDDRQCVYWRRSADKKFSMTFIDNGHCFGGPNWIFRDDPFRGMCRNLDVYPEIRGWDCFEPWLCRIEALSSDDLCEIASEIPPDWHDENPVSVQTILSTLLERRSRVPELIREFQRVCGARLKSVQYLPIHSRYDESSVDHGRTDEMQVRLSQLPA